MNEFIRNNQLMTAVKRCPYQFQDGTRSGWAILYLPTHDRHGHQDGDREEFRTEEERDAAFAALPESYEVFRCVWGNSYEEFPTGRCYESAEEAARDCAETMSAPEYRDSLVTFEVRRSAPE